MGTSERARELLAEWHRQPSDKHTEAEIAAILDLLVEARAVIVKYPHKVVPWPLIEKIDKVVGK